MRKLSALMESKTSAGLMISSWWY